MSPAAVIVFALCGVFVLLSQSLPFLLPVAAGAHRKPIPVKAWLAVGVMMVLLGGGVISTLKPTMDQIKSGGGVFAVMIAGIIGKWLWDGLLKTPFELDAAPLLAALVVSPLVVLATFKVFEDAKTLQSLLLCFSNGFFWQTIFSDLSRRQQNRNKGGKKP
jgi:uncharacterized membrane protein YeaQ/YmgE (transglycosylase-associated protein family)